MKKTSLLRSVFVLMISACVVAAASDAKTPRVMPVDGSSGHGRAPVAVRQGMNLGRQTVIDSIPAPGSSHMGLAWDGAYLWNASNASTPIVVYQIDPTTGTVVTTLTTGINTYVLGTTYLNGSLWIQEWWTVGYTYEIDPATGNILSYFISPAGYNSRGLTDDGTYLWIMDAASGIAYQVTTTGTVIRSVNMYGTVEWAMDAAWDYQRGTLFLCDDGSQNNIKELDVSGSTAVLLQTFAHPGAIYTPEGICYDGQYLWTTAFDAVWIWKIDIGDPAPVGAFWDFETGWQGWTHTSAQTFPAAWDVVSTTYPGGPYWPYLPPPDAGDSAFIIDDDTPGSSVITNDTAMSPVVSNEGYVLLKWGYYVVYDTMQVLLRQWTGTWGSWNIVEAYRGTVGPAWDSVDISGYTGDSLQVAFHYWDEGGWMYGATFDNVGLYAPPVTDVGTMAIIEPAGAYGLNDDVTPQARVKNFGDTDETFPVIFTMTRNAVLVYADTVDMTLDAGAVDTAAFNLYTFTQAGAYDLVCYTALAGDQDPDNDTAYGAASVFEWVEDFEASNGGFVADPAAGAWEWGVPTSGPGAAHSGTNVWATILAGNYLDYANWKLSSQEEYTATENNPHIAFYHWYNMESYWDGGNVKYSTDNGTTWLLLYPIDGYDDIASTANSGIPAESCFTGNHASWEPEEMIIPINAGQAINLRFHFGSDGSVTYPGWYVDDLAGLGLTVGISEEPGTVGIAAFGFAPRMSTMAKDQVSIIYTTTLPGLVSLQVYDGTGRLVQTLVNTQQPAGEKSFVWNRMDVNGRAVANGVYFLKLEAEGETAVHKLILVR